MAKNFSRKGAKAQKEIPRPTTLFAPLRLCGRIFLTSLLLLTITSTAVLGQNKSARFDPDGSFWIVGETPNDFSDFSAINLNAKNSRRLPTSGYQTNDGRTYRFKTLIVKRDNFTFTTVRAAGVSYSFAGKFLKGGNFAAAWMGDDDPVLEGTLTKFRDGKKVAEAKLKFSYFGGT